MGAHARADHTGRGRDPGGSDARVRHRDQYVRAGHGLRRRRQARPDPDQSPCRDFRTGDCAGGVPEPRGSAAVPGVSRPGARFRLLPLRSDQAQVHHAQGDPAASRGRAGGHGDPRRRQRRRRAAVVPRRHACQARPAGSGLWVRPLQRLQHVLLPGSLVDLRRLVGLAGRGHPRPRGRAQRRRRDRCGVELLPAAGSRGAGAALPAGGQARAARHARGRA